MPRSRQEKTRATSLRPPFLRLPPTIIQAIASPLAHAWRRRLCSVVDTCGDASTRELGRVRSARIRSRVELHDTTRKEKPHIGPDKCRTRGRCEQLGSVACANICAGIREPPGDKAVDEASRRLRKRTNTRCMLSNFVCLSQGPRVCMGRSQAKGNRRNPK